MAKPIGGRLKKYRRRTLRDLEMVAAIINRVHRRPAGAVAAPDLAPWRFFASRAERKAQISGIPRQGWWAAVFFRSRNGQYRARNGNMVCQHNGSDS
jgi:hypothetical protein